MNSDDYRPQEREGEEFVVQGDGVESAEENDAEEEAPAITSVTCDWIGLTVKGQFAADVKQTNIDKKAKDETKKAAKAKTTAARKGFVRASQMRETTKKNEDID